MRRQNRSSWSPWILAGAVGVAALLCALALGVLAMLKPAEPGPAPTAAIIVIPAPTGTTTPDQAFATPTGTPPAEMTGGIAVGMYVQIAGTDGEGLRLRTGPGITNEPRFLGMDAEVFEVKDGPKLADGYTWWYLVAPYDENRSGWAASDYLGVVSTDTP